MEYGICFRVSNDAVLSAHCLKSAFQILLTTLVKQKPQETDNMAQAKVSCPLFNF